MIQVTNVRMLEPGSRGICDLLEYVENKKDSLVRR